MKLSRLMTGLALAAATMLPAAGTLSAADRWDAVRTDYRDLSYDHRNVDRLRDQIDRDQRRLNEDTRHNNWSAVRHDRQVLESDRLALQSALRDAGHDRVDAFADRHDYRPNR